MRAYHGSPHLFSQFEFRKSQLVPATPEGEVYFTSCRNTALLYSITKSRGAGYIYIVELSRPVHILHMDDSELWFVVTDLSSIRIVGTVRTHLKDLSKEDQEFYLDTYT